ncbi:adenylyl-sulfate kinase [Desulfobaculum bizertense]|uniref:Adenylylsulfate kinase n=1 Tax=Desulfobaculum bizertense DSM 18034 TaxID=1121442 RepID=A0A1T4VNJ3_9BACT|nr:adenylyl-sulfate kinase [Desulfobaculum bizertense]UIJ38117.1 adenylyl-sulfate kinase [Desulfobaculum bizertense]SKA66428.1 adenylylsulfate kinase [Desulfobaculum bizertense DSM 18034]
MSETASAQRQGWAIWVVGLPGSGKTNLARGLAAKLSIQGDCVVWLQMDARRKAYFPEPTYSDEEREEAYRLFADEAAALTREGKNVVMDGSAFRADMRDYARSMIPDFAEVHVQCSLEEAMKREHRREKGLVMADLYRKALERKETGKEFPGLGKVIGVDVVFEESPQAEYTINNEFISKDETLRRTLRFVREWLQGVEAHHFCDEDES